MLLNQFVFSVIDSEYHLATKKPAAEKHRQQLMKNSCTILWSEKNKSLARASDSLTNQFDKQRINNSSHMFHQYCMAAYQLPERRSAQPDITVLSLLDVSAGLL